MALDFFLAFRLKLKYLYFRRWRLKPLALGPELPHQLCGVSSLPTHLIDRANHQNCVN